jgi:SAM-dependent methyltransferase
LANFLPLKQYILYCIDKLIEQYGLSWPFLDVGCGIGDVSRHVASKGWQGEAIDFSDIAIEKAKKNLAAFPHIQVEKKSLPEETGSFKTIFLMDILEHIDEDNAALQKISSLLSSGGQVIISVPSNPREWRWDDDFYGHCRRYAPEDIKKKLIKAGLRPLVFWDFTYPFFWLMRRIYTGIKSPPKDVSGDRLVRTVGSTSMNAWDIPLLSDLLQQKNILWQLIYRMQFAYFKNKIEKGHEMIILAKKTE